MEDKIINPGKYEIVIYELPMLSFVLITSVSEERINIINSMNNFLNAYYCFRSSYTST